MSSKCSLIVLRNGRLLGPDTFSALCQICAPIQSKLKRRLPAKSYPSYTWKMTGSIDGIDQSGLLLLGEGKGRRDFIFHYNRDSLEAVRKDQIKLNLKSQNPGFHFYEVYNLYHDPAERFPNEIANGLWAGPGMTKMIQEHMLQIQKYPHRKVQGYYRDFDYSFDPEHIPLYTPKKTVDW